MDLNVEATVAMARLRVVELAARTHRDVAGGRRPWWRGGGRLGRGAEAPVVARGPGGRPVVLPRPRRPLPAAQR